MKASRECAPAVQARKARTLLVRYHYAVYQMDSSGGPRRPSVYLHSSCMVSNHTDEPYLTELVVLRPSARPASCVSTVFFTTSSQDDDLTRWSCTEHSSWREIDRRPSNQPMPAPML